MNADDEYMDYIAVLRGNAEGRFRPVAYTALRKYFAANENQFPTDVSQLQPFFEA